MPACPGASAFAWRNRWVRPIWLPDAYLHRSPVLALTGRKPPMFRHRNAYQEIEHAPLFASVTRMQATVEVAGELPLLLAQALREACTGTPRPVHFDLNGLMGEFIKMAQLNAPSFPDPRYGRIPAHRPAPILVVFCAGK